MDALSIFVNLIDRMVGLIKHRDLRRREAIDEIITPLFNDFQFAVDDYFAMFRRARDVLETPPHMDLNQLVTELRERRERHLTARVRVREMAAALLEANHSKPMRTFAESVVRFFHADYEGRKMSASRQLLDLLAQIEGSDSDGQARDHVRKVMLRMEDAWASAAAAYARLRVR